MKTLTGKEFCRILESRGWQLRRIKGSHLIFTQVGISARISVPVHGDGPHGAWHAGEHEPAR